MGGGTKSINAIPFRANVLNNPNYVLVPPQIVISDHTQLIYNTASDVTGDELTANVAAAVGVFSKDAAMYIGMLDINEYVPREKFETQHKRSTAAASVPYGKISEHTGLLIPDDTEFVHGGLQMPDKSIVRIDLKRLRASRWMRPLLGEWIRQTFHTDKPNVLLDYTIDSSAAPKLGEVDLRLLYYIRLYYKQSILIDSCDSDIPFILYCYWVETDPALCPQSTFLWRYDEKRIFDMRIVIKEFMSPKTLYTYMILGTDYTDKNSICYYVEYDMVSEVVREMIDEKDITDQLRRWCNSHQLICDGGRISPDVIQPGPTGLTMRTSRCLLSRKWLKKELATWHDITNNFIRRKQAKREKIGRSQKLTMKIPTKAEFLKHDKQMAFLIWYYRESWKPYMIKHKTYVKPRSPVRPEPTTEEEDKGPPLLLFGS